MRTQLTINNEFLDGISIDSQGGLFKLEKDKIFIDGFFDENIYTVLCTIAPICENSEPWEFEMVDGDTKGLGRIFNGCYQECIPNNQERIWENFLLLPVLPRPNL